MTSVLGLDFGNVIKASGSNDPMPGLTFALSQLKAYFQNIYVVSRIDNDAGSQMVRRFLDEHNYFNCIDPQNVHFCLYRDEKAGIVGPLGITHFVDDRTEVLSHMTSVQYRYAMNPTKKQLQDFPPIGMKVVADWVELLPILFNDAPQTI